MKTAKIFLAAIIVTGAAAYARAVEGAGMPAAPGQSVVVSTAADMEKLSAMPLDTLKAKTKAAKDNQDYRIETEKENNTGWQRVKFISPEGKIVRVLRANPFKMALIPKSGKHVLYTPEEYMGDVYHAKVDEQGYLDYSVSLYDVKGDRKWKKEFKTYPQHSDVEGVEEPWDNGLSDDGERIYVNYCDEKSTYTLTVFNSSGDVITEVKHNMLLSGIEISPDGKIIGAETVKDGSKYLFFIEVDTGKTKLVRAQNNIGFGGAYPYALTKNGEGKPPTGYVTLWWNYWNPKSEQQRRGEQIHIEFNKLPDDVSKLLPAGGGEK